MHAIPTMSPTNVDDDLLAIVQHRLLLAIVQHRLQGFQQGPFACPENARALELVMDARNQLGLRVARRIAQGVLGVNATHETTPRESPEAAYQRVSEEAASRAALVARIREVEAERDEARAALLPFARHAELYRDDVPDEYRLLREVTVGDLRRAARVVVVGVDRD